MQFIENGPDIPESLLQSHEEGRVVFFCGAGISYPAGLPSFKGLVEEIYRLNDTKFDDDIERVAFEHGQFDTTLDLLERRLPGQRLAVRRALAKALRPKLRRKGAVDTHAALLRLARSRKGALRLVTTNFDCIFHVAAKRIRQPFQAFAAPMLPIPKNSRWDGLVYLHGLLPQRGEDEEAALNRLVVTSGDFGLAYLTERWAARFVSELFRNHMVCFVGYSINDPVLRYMMDALAADRMQGEVTPQAWALGDCEPGQENRKTIEWKAKGVTPILYNVSVGGGHDHSALHKTLHAWAETYRDGVRGKERIVDECAIARPFGSTKQDYFIPRMLWALSDPSGLPAKRFAELDPVPSLDWLAPLSEGGYIYADLDRSGISQIVDAGAYRGRRDKVMRHLAHWMSRHLDDPSLLLWLVKYGGQLHDGLTWLVKQRLDELAQLEHEDNTAELTQIRAKAPIAIPGPSMRTLWRLLLTGRVKSSPRNNDLYRWHSQFKRDGLTASLRLELREILTPRVSLREPFNWPDDDRASPKRARIKDLVEWNIVLSTKHVYSSLQHLPKDESWIAALPELLSDFSTLLRDALDLMRELDGADDRSDRSCIYHPSISEHPQNKYFRDWTALIELTRDAWLAAVVKSPERAALVAELWSHTPYPLFRRLAFFAAAQGNVIPLRRAVDWLLADDRWWLWSVETQREAMRLLVALAPQLDEEMLGELEQALLTGPPRDMFKDDIEPECLTRVVDREIWLRLAKIDDAGAALSTTSKKRLEGLSARYPEWTLAVDQRDEFPFWMGSGDEWRKFIAIPRRRRELIEWLRQHPHTDHWQEDDWRQRCRDNFATTACALCALAREGFWPAERWREALQAWSEEKLLKRSWRYMAQILVATPDDVLQILARGVSWWLQTIAEVFEGQETTFFTLARRILAFDYQNDVDDTHDPVMRAINHPVGHTTEALLRWWYRRSLEDGQGLPDELKPTFTEFCDIRIGKFRHGRVLLAAHIITLYRVDQGWATQHLLPLFDWQRSTDEACAVWKGFLWSPRLYRPLMQMLKPAFLDTARYYLALGTYGGQYVSLLTFAALDPSDTFTTAELAAATRSLPPDGLHDTAQALVRALESAGGQRSEYWTNRVSPYLRAIWPNNRANISPAISESFARLCIAAQEAFP